MFMNNKDPMLEMFIFENSQLTERLEEVLVEGDSKSDLDSEQINEIFRIMHTIKGSSAMMSFTNMSTLAHFCEDMFFYIRENEGVHPDWERIIDLCLQSVDFIKAEAAKIQQGLACDGDENSILSEIKEYMKVLKGGSADVALTEDVKADVSAPPQAEIAAADGELRYRAKIFFQPDCKMENIRAYQIVSAIMEIASSVTSNPPELLEDCSEDIVKNGVELDILAEAHIDEIKSRIKDSIFVSKFDVTKVENEQPALEVPLGAEAASDAETAADSAAQAAEQKAAPVQKAAAAPAETSVKQSYISVSVDKLDKLMDLVGELVTAVSMVTKNPDLDGLRLDNFEKSAALLRKNADELQDVVMSVRMIPVSSTFHKMNRIVRDTSRKMNKEVELLILGEETEVDKNIIDNLSDPLMHIIRNSMDHGLENTKDDRLAAGKAAVGSITLEAKNAGSDVIISVTDDGRGMNKDKILSKAINQGIIKENAELSDKEIYSLTMLPGFSTKDQVTELSGRGVGMDVVKKNIEKVGGSVLIESATGKGTTTTIKIPLTLAILNGMEIKVGHNVYIVPTLNIRESFKPSAKDIIVDPDGNEMLMLRGEVYNIVRLHEVFGIEAASRSFEDGIMLMGEDEGKTIAIFADQLIGEQQVVVKPIPSFILKRIGTIKGVSGCTIMGDGSISLIVDTKGLMA